MKIKFAPGWCSSEDGTKRLFDQFYIDQDLSGVEFVHGQEYDILFSCCYEKNIPPNLNVPRYIFSMEPSWSGNQQPSNCGHPATIFAQGSDWFCDPSKVIVGPTYVFYGAGGEGWTYDTVVRDCVYPKTKNISSIISSLKNRNGHRNATYTERRGLVTSMLASNVNVDVYGWDPALYPKALGLPQKINGLIPYKFTVAVENSFENNWVSEKFYDAILTDTIPIYLGAPNIREIYPENGYFVLDDLMDTDATLKLLHEINENADELYDKMLPELQKIKHRYFTEFNLLTKILEIANGTI